MNAPETHEVAVMIRLSFDDFPEEHKDLDTLKQLLSERIVALLINDMEKLLFILYRIDVNEQKFKTALASGNPKSIAPQIADLIIERQLQKLITRKKYNTL
jgi:hypothetical protein